MVSNKRYKYALERWNEWENIATNAVKENGVLLKEMKEINDLSKRINDNNGALIEECRRLREQLAVVTAERDHYLDLLPNVSEVEPAAKEEALVEDPEAQWDRYYLNV
jgi:hypothetical protein